MSRPVVGLGLCVLGVLFGCEGSVVRVGEEPTDLGPRPRPADRGVAPSPDGGASPDPDAGSRDVGVSLADAGPAVGLDAGPLPRDLGPFDAGPPGVCPPGLRADAWTELTRMNRPRGEHASVVYDGRILTFGGIHDSRNGPSQVEAYDPALDEWEDIADLPDLRNHFTVGHALVGHEVWICGGKPDGQGNGGVTRVEVYDARTGVWRRGPDLPEEHWAGPTVLLGRELHVLGGGISNTRSTTHHFVLDVDDEAAGWRTAAPLLEARVHVAGVPFDGEVWVIGGEFEHRHNGDTTLVQIYDPVRDEWRRGPALPEARSHHEWATFTHDGVIWTVSGVDSSNRPRGQATIYTLASEAAGWRRTTFDLPGQLVSPGARIIDDVLYVFGGGVGNWFSGDLRTTWARCL